MSREDINELIAKYTAGQITTEQYRKLREEINHRSEEELLSMLQQEWEKSLLLKDDLVTSDLSEYYFLYASRLLLWSRSHHQEEK